MILKELKRERLEVFKLTVGARICQAASMMREKKVGAIVIVDDADMVIGIVTDRDIALSLALGAATPNSFVAEVMSVDVECVHEDMTLFNLTSVFRTVDVKRVPVVDSTNVWSASSLWMT